MPRKFAFSDDGSRYHTLKYHNRLFWGRPVYKAVVDAGFTCPNIDGSCGYGGCIYCSGGSGYFTAPELTVSEQIRRETVRILSAHPEAGIIAYFQSHTNTYGSLERMREVYSQALECGICGISAATRADCLEPEKIAWLASCCASKEIWLELGVQSVHDATAQTINRGHSYAEVVETVQRLALTPLKICVHLINGLPSEDEEMMLESI